MVYIDWLPSPRSQLALRMSRNVRSPSTGQRRQRSRTRAWPIGLLAIPWILGCSGGGGGSDAAPTRMEVTVPASVATTGVAGGPFSVSSFDFVVRNVGGSPMDWSATSAEPWASVVPASGQLGAGDDVTVTVSLMAPANSLPPGIYNGSIDFVNETNGDGDTSSVVRLHALAPAELQVTTAGSLTTSGNAGGPFSVGSFDVDVANIGEVDLDWTAESTETWAALSLAGGTLLPGELATLTVTIEPEANTLPVGIHTGSIDFVNETNGLGNGSEGIVLHALAPPGLSVTPDFGLVTNGPEGGPFTTTSLDYQVANTSASPVDWVATSADPRIDVSPSGGTLLGGEMQTLTVSIDPVVAAGLKAGTYTTSVSIVNTTNGTGSTTRPVTLNVLFTGTKADSVTQFGITWFFDREYEVGQFANGDWWVVGPVTIVNINPPSGVISGRTLNGTMANPAPILGLTQGYDSSMYAQYKSPGTYDPALNLGLNLTPATPLMVSRTASIVSTVSRIVPNSRPQVQLAAILTVLDQPAVAGSFRPPYCGERKEVRFNESQLDYDLLADLPRLPSTPALASIRAAFQKPWIDHVPFWPGRYIHPSDSMPDYGRDMVDAIGTATLMLNLNYTDDQKRELLVSVVQLGIDLFGIIENGGENNWIPAAGHTSGRKWAILFAGIMLGDPAMSGIGFDPIPQFGEDGQTFYVEETSPGVYNYGFGGYTAAHVGLPEWGTAHSRMPSDDDVTWFGDPYRLCCTANAWWGQILSAYIMGAKVLWNHDALFDYQERYRTENIRRGITDWRLAWSRFPYDMWKAYRANY